MSESYVLLSIAAVGLVTFLVRALPFLAAKWLKHHPLVRQVGEVLPSAIMMILLVHSMRGLSELRPGTGWEVLVCVAVCIGLQLKFRQPFLSMAAGTVLYILWLQAT
jgi:branched-subunit amino acid transport protein AzlD